MSSTRPLKRYLEACDAIAKGRRGEAAAAAEDAFGSKPNNLYIRENVEKLLDHESTAGRVVLDLVRVEMQRRGNDH